MNEEPTVQPRGVGPAEITDPPFPRHPFYDVEFSADGRPMFRVPPEDGEIIGPDMSGTRRKAQQYVEDVMARTGRARGKSYGKRVALEKLTQRMVSRAVEAVVVTSGGRPIGKAVSWSPVYFAYQLDNGMWVDERDVIPVGTAGDTEYWQLMPNRETYTGPPMRRGRAFSDHNPDVSHLMCSCPLCRGGEYASDEHEVQAARAARAGAQEARQSPGKGRPVSVRPPRAIETGGGE